MIRLFPAISFLLFALLLSGSELMAQKIDTVYHINGNILTGDLKKMNYGVISWSMEGMGTSSLEVPKVKSMKSSKQFEFKLKEGLIYFGSIDSSNRLHHIYIVMKNGRELVDINEIVEIYPIRRNFWMRTKGNFSLGLNYTKGSEIATVVLSGNLNYRPRRSIYEIKWSSNNTVNLLEDTLTSKRTDVTLSWQYLLQKNWSVGIFGGASQNTQLGIRIRWDLAGLVIRDVVYNHWNRFWVGAGLSVQRETPFSGEYTLDDLAGVTTIVWKVYKYTQPKVWLDSDLTFLPYITGDSRYRLNLNVNPSISIIDDDLKVGFEYYYSYDSRPPVNASTFDWGINLEITYSFH